MRKNDVKVCLTTELFNSYNNLKATVVVVDLLRATSVISTAFHYGIESIIPVMSLDEALSYKNKPKHLIAAERILFLLTGLSLEIHHFTILTKI
jgi:2-phosphosulfolactate phosphatase